MPKTNAPEISCPTGPQAWQPPGRRGGAGWLPVFCGVGISALAACAPAAAWAQENDKVNPGVALKSACRTDYRAHCVGSDPAAPIAAACLAQYYLNLSKNCQAALDAYNAPPGDNTEQE